MNAFSTRVTLFVNSKTSSNVRSCGSISNVFDDVRQTQIRLERKENTVTAHTTYKEHTLTTDLGRATETGTSLYKNKQTTK